ncbi:MAG: S41 family peptidase [Flavobacteriales bacterium]|nr:S41 family peptidase [Flavobacteriales bacterium]
MQNEPVSRYESTGTERKPGFTGSPLVPMIMALVLIVGIVLGYYLRGNGGQSAFHAKPGNAGKLVSVINYIEANYVDSIEKRDLVEAAIEALLADLDPHSGYISAEDLAAFTEPLEGQFDGIGIEFLIQRDTLFVVRTVEGGPSDKAGILAGDRIVKVNGIPITGAALNADTATSRLKGPRGTAVKVTVKRGSEFHDYDLKRDGIPIESVTAAFKVDAQTGYIKLERFAKPTYQEFMAAAHQMRDEGVSRLIIDLRDNGGGFMQPATEIIEEFLTPGKLIVYTEGAHQPKEEVRSGKNGLFKDMDVVVLIDQNSASASEIVAGALQDWDRSVTVGRRSFGKGLVQHEIPLPDNSAMRLTVARYYTPTGRCIQKPYGDTIDYFGDVHDRFVHGEFLSADSIDFPEELKKITPGGRTVYGGGGIMPDVFVPIDSVFLDPVLVDLNSGALVRDFCFNYADRYRTMLTKQYTAETFETQFVVTDDILRSFLDVARREKIDYTFEETAHVRDEMKLRLKAQIARNIFGDGVMFRILLQRDRDFEKALEVLKSFQDFTWTQH